MRSRALFYLLVMVLVVAPLGCGGADHIPFNPFLALEETRSGIADGTRGAETLPLEAVQPGSARIGEYVVVKGQGRTFPAGYARFTFSGNSTEEVFLARSTGEIRVRIPPGTLTGPFGFQISGKSSKVDQGGGNFASATPVPSYRILYPGLRILGPSDPPGGPANSPYPQGPSMVPSPAPSFP